MLNVLMRSAESDVCLDAKEWEEEVVRQWMEEVCVHVKVREALKGMKLGILLSDDPRVQLEVMKKLEVCPDHAVQSYRHQLNDLRTALEKGEKCKSYPVV